MEYWSNGNEPAVVVGRVTPMRAGGIWQAGSPTFRRLRARQDEGSRTVGRFHRLEPGRRTGGASKASGMTESWPNRIMKTHCFMILSGHDSVMPRGSGKGLNGQKPKCISTKDQETLLPADSGLPRIDFLKSVAALKRRGNPLCLATESGALFISSDAFELLQ